MPESNTSLEWNVKVAGPQEIKLEPKGGFSSYTEAKAMLSTTHIRMPHQYRLPDVLNSQASNSRPESIEKDRKFPLTKDLPNFEPAKKCSLNSRNSGTKTPLLQTQSERSPKPLDSQGPSRHVSFQNLSMTTVASSIKKKMNWHVDQ